RSSTRAAAARPPSRGWSPTSTTGWSSWPRRACGRWSWSRTGSSPTTWRSSTTWTWRPGRPPRSSASAWSGRPPRGRIRRSWPWSATWCPSEPRGAPRAAWAPSSGPATTTRRTAASCADPAGRKPRAAGSGGHGRARRTPRRRGRKDGSGQQPEAGSQVLRPAPGRGLADLQAGEFFHDVGVLGLDPVGELPEGDHADVGFAADLVHELLDRVHVDAAVPPLEVVAHEQRGPVPVVGAFEPLQVGVACLGAPPAVLAAVAPGRLGLVDHDVVVHRQHLEVLAGHGQRLQRELPQSVPAP